MEPTSPAVVADQGQTRWAIVVRDRGQDVSSQLLHAVAGLRKEGIRVGGFVQVPKRIRSRVAGYDLKRVIGNKRLCLAHREAPIGTGPVLAYRSFQFREDSFVKAREWLERDAVDADVLKRLRGRRASLRQSWCLRVYGATGSPPSSTSSGWPADWSRSWRLPRTRRVQTRLGCHWSPLRGGEPTVWGYLCHIRDTR